MTTALRQTVAMFIDAYRELAAGKLFWITLLLSGLVALVFAAVGIDERGMTVLWFRLPIPITSAQIPPGTLYKFLFFQFGIGLWLTWIATILGLITTSGIIPSLVSSGVIDSMVAKPISRTRLFLTRGATGLLFAALQVALFSAGVFLVLGLRGGEWLWTVFLAVPIVVVFYSYLFAVMALIGLMTRSAIASLLLTLLVWFMLFILNFADASLIQLHEQARIRVDRLESRIARAEANTAQVVIQSKQAEDPSVPDGYTPTPEEIDAANPFLVPMRSSLEEAREDEGDLRPWTRGLFVAKTALPKTSETIGLLGRYIFSEDEVTALLNTWVPSESDAAPDDEKSSDVVISPRETQLAVTARLESRSLGWIIGTSLAFEACVLGVACVIFARRDF
jgi:hypothetical protein